MVSCMHVFLVTYLICKKAITSLLETSVVFYILYPPQSKASLLVKLWQHQQVIDPGAFDGMHCYLMVTKGTMRWEIKFLSYMKIRKLKQMILLDVAANPPAAADMVADADKNETAFAEIPG